MHRLIHPDEPLMTRYNFEEMCPDCGTYIPVEIDYNCFDSYEGDCPVCGYRMMLCTLCYWDQEDEADFDGQYKCDWSERRGCYRKGGRNK